MRRGVVALSFLGGGMRCDVGRVFRLTPCGGGQRTSIFGRALPQRSSLWLRVVARGLAVGPPLL